MGSPGEIRVEVMIKAEVPNLGTITPITTKIQTEEGVGIEATILHIELSRPVEPHEVKKILEAVNRLKKFISNELVVLSGRMPVWMFVAIAHAFHGFARAVATFEPKMGAAIVVMSHHPKLQEMQAIKLPQEIVERLTQLK